MSDIRHAIHLEAAPADVFRALSTIEGLAGWWTETTSGETTLDGEIAFRFGTHVTAMKVTGLETDRRVEWTCTSGAPEWTDTKVRFSLSTPDPEKPNRTLLAFGHDDWQETTPFLAHCSMKWATFLLSLRALVETGTGAPFPNDLAI